VTGTSLQDLLHQQQAPCSGCVRRSCRHHPDPACWRPPLRLLTGLGPAHDPETALRHLQLLLPLGRLYCCCQLAGCVLEEGTAAAAAAAVSAGGGTPTTGAAHQAQA
jgi:hypothetical protein